ncbi:MAG TPA: hypothetical protein VHF46_06405, partial [Rubrobacteraceae bacterium]|nr:hypothetical protein [Rubrobacteraceae bacterium]
MILGSVFRCPVCEVRLSLEGVERWVRGAEKARDEAYSMVEGDEELANIVHEERQLEVYRRRKVLYELRKGPRAVVARPE